MPMFSIGQQVKVTGVFAEAFPINYTVSDIIHNAEDGTTVYMLDQGAGGFDAIYLEAV